MLFQVIITNEVPVTILSAYIPIPQPGVQIFIEHWGDNLQFYPNFALFSTLGGMNLDHYVFQVRKLSEEQKKVFTKNGTLFSQSSEEDQKKIFTKNGTRRVARNSQWGG